MGLYKCIVFNSTGKRQVIKIDSFSKEDILKYLKNNNFIVIDVKNIKQSIKEINLLRFNDKLKSKELSLLCKQVHTMLKSGITIVKCIEILSTQTENKRLNKLLSLIYKELLVGSTFSEAIEKYKASFPLMFITMVKAGEKSGNLDVVIERLANHYIKENKVENKVKSALAYPAVLSVVSTFVVIFLLIKVMPTFVDLYNSSGVSLPFMTVFLLNISHFLQSKWHTFILFIVIIIAVLIKLNNNKESKLILDSYKLRMPFYGVLKLKLSASRFSRTLSALVSNGVSLLDALETVSMIVENEYIAKNILNAREDVKSGSSLSYCLKKQNIFPKMIASMVYIGEESGELAETLDKIADFYDEEVENAVQSLISLIEPIMIVAMAIIVGFIMLAMVTPMFDMVNLV